MSSQTESPYREFPPSDRTATAPKYDTPALNDLLLRIFGEEHRDLIHSTLTDLDDELAPDPTRALNAAANNEDAQKADPPNIEPTRTSPAPRDPFKAFGDELRFEERLTYREAFER